MSTQLTTIGPRPALRVPGYLSVRAAAERLGIRERSVRELIERRRLRSTRLGRIHFLSSEAVERYRGERRVRARRSRALRRARVARAAA
jgi:excisionase family DNA binding protein